MALALAAPLLSAASSVVTNITQLGASIIAKEVAENCISSLYGYFQIKCDLDLRTHFLWLRIGFIVGPAQTGGKRYGREVKLAELVDVRDFPQKMQSSNFTCTLNEYLQAVQSDLVGRKVMHHNKPNEDFDEVLRLLNDGVFQPMIIFLSHYQRAPQTTNPSQPSSSTQPQQTTAQEQSFFPYGNLLQSQNSNAVFDQSLPFPSIPQPTAINNNSDIASGSQNNNGSQSSNTTAKTEERPAVPAQKRMQSQNAIQVEPSSIFQGAIPNDLLETQGSLANITSVNPPSSSTTNTTQEQSGSTPSILPSQGVYLLTPLSVSYQGQQPQPQSQQPKTTNLVDQQGNLFFKPIATPNLF